MKNVLKISVLLAVLALAPSCQDEGELDPPQPEYSEDMQDGQNPEEDQQEIPADSTSTGTPLQPGEVSVKALASDTKTMLSSNAVLWEDGDRIAIVFNSETEGAHVGSLETSIEEGTSPWAEFKGRISADLTDAYQDQGFAVYPDVAVGADGQVNFTLPSVQTTRPDGTFAAGLNLSSASLSLADIKDDGQAEVQFRNAFAILRFKMTDKVQEISLTGTAPLAGTAPMKLDFADEKKPGRLVIDTQKQWEETDKSYTLTLKPDEAGFKKDVVYNLLILPCTHSSLTLKVTFSDIGVYEKTVNGNFAFEQSKFYTLGFKDSDALITEVSGKIGSVEEAVLGLDEILSGLDEDAAKIYELLSQIQSVALMTEYLDNAVYAPYVKKNYSTLQKDIKLDYVVRPAAAMQAMLDLCRQNGNLSEVLSAQVQDRNGRFGQLTVTDAQLNGDIMTVTVDASGLWSEFYSGSCDVSLALQISDGNTELYSEFANLVPKSSVVLEMSRTEDVPVLKGALFSTSFAYGGEDIAACKVEVTGIGFSSPPTVKYANGSGNISAYFAENDNLAGMSLKVTLTEGDETETQLLTFADGGEFKVETSGKVDYVGGEVSVNVTSNSFGSYTMQLSGAGNWIYETNSGVGGLYTVDSNNGSARSAALEFTINNGSITYTKSVAVSQSAYGTALTREYYSNGAKVILNQKTVSGVNALNIVILGDGYQKKDLLKGGKFERSARSAMDSFFSIEPYKSFKDRFNVYMVAYESVDEGTDINSSNVTKNTYFGTYCAGGGNTAAYVNDESRVVNAVKNVVGSSDDQYYRSIAIVLVNTNEQAGSTGYPFRDYKSGFVNGYASFAIAVLAANTTGTNGLVKHEAGGHAFGRLADEYYSGGTASSSNKTDLNNWHAKGWYWNVNPSNSGNYYKFTNSAYSSDEVKFIEGAWGYAYGMYRPTSGGMMQSNTGVFNVPSRHAIYHRIITESEGAGAYSWNNFLEYDRDNR